MRFVPIKTEEQLDLQAVHRRAERWVTRRTAVVQSDPRSSARTGLTLPKGQARDHALPDILEDATLLLSDSFRVLLAQLKLELDQLTARIEQMGRCNPTNGDRERGFASDSQPSRNRSGNGDCPDRCHRQWKRISERARPGGWVGMVPRDTPQAASKKLLGISKRGQRLLRRLFVQGARVVMQYRTKQAPPGLSCW